MSFMAQTTRECEVKALRLSRRHRGNTEGERDGVGIGEPLRPPIRAVRGAPCAGRWQHRAAGRQQEPDCDASYVTLSVPTVVQKYYSLVPACRCGEHEVRHICRYHGRQAGEEELQSAEDKVRRVWCPWEGCSFHQRGTAAVSVAPVCHAFVCLTAEAGEDLDWSEPLVGQGHC